MRRRPVIGVMGGHRANAATLEMARRLGAVIAGKEWILLTGGRDEGVMAAATAGAREAGGFTIGVHPGRREDEAADADVIIFTGMGFARNAINVLSSDVIVALAGAEGTLSEVAYARTFGVPTVLLGFDDAGWFGDDVDRADDVERAIEFILGHLAPA